MQEKIFDESFFQKIYRLKLNIPYTSNSSMMGGRKSNAKGTSVEFSDYREYLLGDDLRRIDWNAYGRFDRMFVKLFREEREGVFHIFLDSSSSMDYGERNKKVAALQIAGSLAYMVLKNSDRVSVHTVRQDSVTVSKGRVGMSGFMRILSELDDYEFDDRGGFLNGILRYPFQTKGVSILISDFYEIEQLETLLKYLKYKKQEIILIQVLSKEECNPELTGALRLIDSESDDFFPMSVTGNVLREYQNAYEQFKTELRKQARKYQAGLTEVMSDESFEQILYQITG